MPNVAASEDAGSSKIGSTETVGSVSTANKLELIMKRAILIIGVAFSITVGVVFGIRASADALAVIIGVVLGVAASVPTTFLITYTLTRSQLGNDDGQPRTMSHQPPVIVINTADKPGGSYPIPALPALSAPTHGRQWTVIGDGDTDQ